MNPTPIVDNEIEAIVLVFIAIPAQLDQWTMVRQGIIQQQVMVTRVSSGMQNVFLFYMTYRHSLMMICWIVVSLTRKEWK